MSAPVVSDHALLQYHLLLSIEPTNGKYCYHPIMTNTCALAKRNDKYAPRFRQLRYYRRVAAFQMAMLALTIGIGASRKASTQLTVYSTRSCSAFALYPAACRGIPYYNLAISTVRYLSGASTDSAQDSSSPISSDTDDDNTTKFIPPWSLPRLRNPNSKAFARFRQHVNPLARRFQMPTDLPEDWPHCDFDDINLPLYLDIGCGKGGFLLDLVGRRHRGNTFETDDSEDTSSQWLPSQMNYLGLEIRPGVSQYAQARVEKKGLSGKLSFVGCNANVDLERLLNLYHGTDKVNITGKNNRLAFVSIQFPDPHFKKQHAKRRVVTPSLVHTLAKFMKKGDVVFLQSDVKDVLVDMRERFCEDGEMYFIEFQHEKMKEYELENPLGVPTEREVSVQTNDLPIFRTLFRRNSVTFEG
mmetsp:Transcript_5602/g.12373  ORF Transcript_5602/g.12373 Transcript_5602/m.12373 type:complete len:414 (+) Transcript_5602:14-1255(+)